MIWDDGGFLRHNWWKLAYWMLQVTHVSVHVLFLIHSCAIPVKARRISLENVRARMQAGVALALTIWLQWFAPRHECHNGRISCRFDPGRRIRMAL